MIILIDGYNYIRRIIPWRDVSEKERNQFLQEFARYAKRKKHKIIVVFDGGPYDWTHKEHFNGVHIVYSGIHESADDYIIGYLKTHKHRDLLLVSSDHEINIWASKLDIPSISSGDFEALLQEALQKDSAVPPLRSGQAVKISEEKSEIDELMKEASEVVPIKNADIAKKVKRKKTAQMASKRDRKLLAKLRKL